jgi:hypothetical protein
MPISKPASDTAELLQTAVGDLATAKQTVALLEAAETKALETRDAHDNWRFERGRAVAEIDRLEKLIVQLRDQLDRETLEVNRENGAARLSANEALARRLRDEGAPLVEKLLQLLGDLAAADLETAKINARLPDSERIKSADTLARARDARKRQHVKEKAVDLWCYAANGNAVPDQRAVIDRGDGAGYLTSMSSEGEIRCVRLKHMRVEYRPEQPVQRVEPLCAALRLPFFDRPGYAWQGQVTNPAAVLDALARPPAEEQLLTEYVLADPFEPPVEHKPRRNAGGISI